MYTCMMYLCMYIHDIHTHVYVYIYIIYREHFNCAPAVEHGLCGKELIMRILQQWVIYLDICMHIYMYDVFMYVYT